MSRLLCAAALGFALTSPALAHNVDCNNDSVPTEMKSGCCGKEDYRALKPNQVREDDQGYDVFLDGKWLPLKREQSYNGTSTMVWITAQPTGAPCWGVWYRRSSHDSLSGQEIYSSRDGDSDHYHFYCLEQPAAF